MRLRLSLGLSLTRGVDDESNHTKRNSPSMSPSIANSICASLSQARSRTNVVTAPPPKPCIDTKQAREKPVAFGHSGAEASCSEYCQTSSLLRRITAAAIEWCCARDLTLDIVARTDTGINIL